MNINIGRVLLGGLVTGIILNVGEVVLNDIVLGAQTKAFFAEHNFREPGASFLDRGGRRNSGAGNRHCVRICSDQAEVRRRSQNRNHRRSVRVVRHLPVHGNPTWTNVWNARELDSDDDRLGLGSNTFWQRWPERRSTKKAEKHFQTCQTHSP